MDSAMFCYQCEQTFRGSGCVDMGVCGKDSEVAALQDLLVYQLEGISYYARHIIVSGGVVKPETGWFVIEALFSTLTNVNFNQSDFFTFLREAKQVKDTLRSQVEKRNDTAPLAALYGLPVNDEAILRDAMRVNIRPNAKLSEDIQSLKDTLLFGLKGMAAYAHHAWVLGYQDEQVYHYLFSGLSAMIDDNLQVADLVPMLMEFGQVNLRCMELLDRANTTTFGHPRPTYVRTSNRKGPFIVVSGHDLSDLKQLLDQAAGTGVNIYTHGEMLPANTYPGLNKYPNLVGNFGTAWQNQQREFKNLPGCILMTTNCIMEPQESYIDRMYTTGVVGWPGAKHIPVKDGRKDFTEIIRHAIDLGGWADEEEETTLLAGFGREAVLGSADAIITAVKTGQIKHFFLVGGCDGARPGRNYYTQFAEQAPEDTVIMTLACGKYRLNHLNLGTAAGLPRLLDIGQCNDAYSAIRIAVALAEAFECGVNDLPLTLVLSWYEQKAVCILLTLLSLGIKNIYLGPTLPAFLSPNIVQFLVDTFDIHPTTNVEDDMAVMLGTVPA